MEQLQQTLKRSYDFEGKGLHTGKKAKMTVKPAPENHGIKFLRTDLGEDAVIEAVAENVSNTARSTTLTQGKASVVTIEHLLSALTGLGVDNALIEIDNEEVPILDGSAKPYVDAICKDGLVTQTAKRKYIELSQEIVVKNEKTGSLIIIKPSDIPSYIVNIDFDSKVLGVQSAGWGPDGDSEMTMKTYASQVGCCRTFVFFHEIEYLFNNNLIKGGDVDNAIVIVEHPVSQDQIDRMSRLFDIPALAISDNGYLNNLELHYPNECARHKLLDLIGDLRLVGGFLKAEVIATRPGHTINTTAAQGLRQMLSDKNELSVK